MSYKIEYPIWIHGNYQQWHLDYTVSSVKFLQPSITPTFVTNLEKYLETVTSDYVCIQSVGHCIDTRLFETEFLNSNLVNDLIVGHVLLDNRNTPWLHPQCFILNIKLWNELGKPFFGNPKSLSTVYPNFVSSDEMFHDHYTPHSIQRSEGEWIRNCDKFGWNIIKEQLLLMGKVNAFTKSMRWYKKNIYTHSELSHDLSYTATKKYYEEVKQNQVYHFSNDLVPSCGDIDYVITPASGFKGVKHLKINNPKRILIYDCSIKNIEWLDYLRYNWDGCDYDKFFEKHKNDRVLTGSRIFPKPSLFSYKNEWNNIINLFGSEEEFASYWKSFIENIKIRHVDILTYDRNDIISSIQKNEKVLFDLSNIFNMPINVFGRSFECMMEHLEDIKKKVCDITPNATFFGVDCYGRAI